MIEDDNGMQKEYGGYLPLELAQRGEIFEENDGTKVLRLNCGRNAIVVAAKGTHAKKIYIPYYNCDVVREALDLNGIPYEYYLLKDDLYPDVSILNEDEWLLYVNYFGNATDGMIDSIAKKYHRVIFDNTQAFFAKPVLYGNCFNVYSPRKFIGVADGAYLVWKNEIEIEDVFPQDVSWDRAAFLFKSIELGTNAAYKDNLNSKQNLGKEIKRMSVLTQKMLASADYERIVKIRRSNLSVVKGKLDSINQFQFKIDGDLMIYPLLIKNDLLRSELLHKKIYVSQWWKYLIGMVPDDSIEYCFSRWLLPIPIDQRYSEADMLQMTEIILDCYHKIQN